jgi:hypothetical protein
VNEARKVNGSSESDSTWRAILPSQVSDTKRSVGVDRGNAKHSIITMQNTNSRPVRRSAGNPSLAVAYVRVSTEDQNLGPEAQRAAIERWAPSRGITVAAWHQDCLSGATAVEDRPGCWPPWRHSVSMARACSWPPSVTGSPVT